MTEVIPTKEKQTFGGNTFYLDDNGDLVIDHVSGNTIKMFKDGGTETINSEGEIIHQSIGGQSTNYKKDGSIEF